MSRQIARQFERNRNTRIGKAQKECNHRFIDGICIYCGALG